MIGKLLLRWSKKYVLKQLGSVTFKARIVDLVNKKVDIPRLNEKQEKELFSAVYEAIKAAV